MQYHSFPKRKKLKFKNYKIPISRDSDNNIVYNYKLVPGVSNQFIALELLEKKGFDLDIVNEAKNICKNLSLNNFRNRSFNEDVKNGLIKRKRRSKNAGSWIKSIAWYIGS